MALARRTRRSKRQARRIRRAVVLAGFALLAAALQQGVGGLAMARPQAADPPAAGFTGTLWSADAFSVVVRSDGGGFVSFVVDDPFSVPPGLVAGTRVTVRHEARDDGSRRVVRVEVTPLSGDHDSTTEPPPRPSDAPAAPSVDPVVLESEARPEPALPLESERTRPSLPVAQHNQPTRLEPTRPSRPPASPAVDQVALEPEARLSVEPERPLPARPVAQPNQSVRLVTVLLLAFVGGLLLLGARFLRAG